MILTRILFTLILIVTTTGVNAQQQFLGNLYASHRSLACATVQMSASPYKKSVTLSCTLDSESHYQSGDVDFSEIAAAIRAGETLQITVQAAGAKAGAYAFQLTSALLKDWLAHNTVFSAYLVFTEKTGGLVLKLGGEEKTAMEFTPISNPPKAASVQTRSGDTLRNGN